MILNITSTGLVHGKKGTTHGIYPLCNKGLLIGTQAGTLTVFYGKWKHTPEPINCTKCIKITGEN